MRRGGLNRNGFSCRNACAESHFSKSTNKRKHSYIDPDIDLGGPKVFELKISENAARKLKDLISKKGKADNTYLRVYVSGGGCSGFTYGMALDDKVHENETVIETDGIKVVVDPNSAPFLTGSAVDYMESLTGSGFTLSNPNSWSTCGCGHSFSPKDKESTTEEGRQHAVHDSCSCS